MGQLTVVDSGPGERAAPVPSSAQDTFMSWDGIYRCQFHVIVYSLIKTFNAIIQLLSTCIGAASHLSIAAKVCI
jgi:hypothetical protein